MNKFCEYQNLLTKTYDEAVDILLQKYGHALDDYYREASYVRFMQGEIKNITKGKYSRTSEGLYCHHIDEIKILKISDQSFIKRDNIPFRHQKRERLIYCDLIEHTILHVLITKETSNEFGLPGYEVYLKPMIIEWYVEETLPKPQWMQKCFKKSFLTPDEAVAIIKEMEEKIGRTTHYHDAESYFEDIRRKEQEADELRREMEERQRIEDELLRKKAVEKAKQLKKEKERVFYSTYPEFKQLSIHPEISRQKIISLLFEYKYSESYKTRKELDSAMKPLIRDKLLSELYEIVCKVNTFE